MLGKIARKVFGTPNDRVIKATRPIVDKINALEEEFAALTDEGIKAKTECAERVWRMARNWMTSCPRLCELS